MDPRWVWIPLQLSGCMLIAVWVVAIVVSIAGYVSFGVVPCKSCTLVRTTLPLICSRRNMLLPVLDRSVIRIVDAIHPSVRHSLLGRSFSSSHTANGIAHSSSWSSPSFTPDCSFSSGDRTGSDRHIQTASRAQVKSVDHALYPRAASSPSVSSRPCSVKPLQRTLNENTSLNASSPSRIRVWQRSQRPSTRTPLLLRHNYPH